MARMKCRHIKGNGEPCQSFALADSGLCVSHDPARREAQRDESRRGGESRSAARRATRAWAMTGEQVRQEDLPAILRACLLDVRLGKIEASVAAAIATLARTSVSLTAEIELVQRIAALERAAGANHPGTNIRRIG